MSDANVPLPQPKRLVIVMDGTWNSPTQSARRDDGDEVFKPTNPLKTCRAIKALDTVAATLIVDAQPLDGETITIDGKVYTFQDEPADVDGHVKIGDGGRKSLENLLFAINKKRGQNRYADATERHPTVTALKVAGDRRAIDIVWRQRPAGPLATESSSSGLRWASKLDIANTLHERGYDPAQGTPQIAYYDVGVGALRQMPGISNKIHRSIDQVFGGARGAGFESNIEDSYHFLSLNYQPGDEIYLFGFSRGASSVRGLSRFMDWMGGILPSEHSYWIPRYFDAFLAGRSFDATREAIFQHLQQSYLKGHPGETEAAETEAERLLGHVIPARVRFLGVWDSVLSIGEKRDQPFLGEAPPAIVDHARQALAIDEQRPDFKPHIWRHKAPGNPDQTLQQHWFVGVHSNIGGGYLNDGLANISLRWMLKEARRLGLGIDWQFLKHYSAYPQARLYDSKTKFWRLVETVTFRRDHGVREIYVDDDAGLGIHNSVFHRLTWNPEDDRSASAGDEQKDESVLYRPVNLLQFLATLDDRDAFLAEIPGLPEDFALTEEVERAIRAQPLSSSKRDKRRARRAHLAAMSFCCLATATAVLAATEAAWRFYRQGLS